MSQASQLLETQQRADMKLIHRVLRQKEAVKQRFDTIQGRDRDMMNELNQVRQKLQTLQHMDMGSQIE